MPKIKTSKFLPFEQARELVRQQKFKSGKEFKAWVSSENAPDSIPKGPQDVYKSEWQGIKNWLGTEDTPVNKKKFRDFHDAREFVRSLSLSGKNAYAAWLKSGQRPADIPTSPKSAYGDLFKGWGDWLGNGKIYTGAMSFLDFEEAREYVRNLGLKNKDEYAAWAQSNMKPEKIPASPAHVYGDLFKGWGDWLGTGRVANQDIEYLPFAEARAFVRSKKITTRDDWKSFARSPSFPVNIPRNPESYKEWISWGDWFGSYRQWSKKALIGFIKSLYPILPHLEPSELYAILRNNNCLNAIEQLGEDSPLKQLINSTLHGDEIDSEELYSEIEKIGMGVGDDDIELPNEPDRDDDLSLQEEFIPDDKDVEELPELSTSQILENLDHLETVLGISDHETVEFLMNKAIGRLWSRVLRSSSPQGEVDLITSHKASGYSLQVKDRYLDQYRGTSNLPIPEGYAFNKNGELLKPNLMQRLAAYRVLKDSRIGNWSGTGAGKTLGAILASRVIGAKLTIIIGLNNTILGEDTGWAGDIKNAFPSSNILIKEKKDIIFSETKPNYLLLNYETFQLDNSKSVVDEILEKHQVDLIVLDEVHSAKSRDQVESRRRMVINYLLQRAAELNPDLRVLGMSATPVLNSLDEAVSLLEMIKGREYPELETSAKLSNALAIHEQLVINGIRYVPNYAMELKEMPIEIVDNAVADDLKKIGKGQIAQVEITLLRSKISTIISLCKPGTIIFSHYVESIFDELSDAIKAAGFKVARFNGDDKTGIELFKQGKVDILIGSSALGTGVDGLQYVCNRMIIVCLPWTSAGYEQLIGRIYRQGSKFNEVEVFIPQVVLSNNGESWSWDKQRHARIKYKKTLADAAVDGVVPEANLASPNLMLAESKRALDDWLARIESGEIREVPRRVLKVPLPKDAIDNGIHRYGDFSLMNQRFNTSKSSTSHERLVKDPEEFYLYHSLYKEARQTWSEIPFEVMAEQVNKRPDWVVGDFGCGEALLSKSVRNKVYSFDHVAINPSVIACDMSNTGLEGEILDVAVFSLSLMGTNWQDYFKEAFRMLRPGGLLKISEPASGWEKDNFSELKLGIEAAGFQLLGDAKLSSKFVYFDAAKPL
jgi:superfamily II DNA or RNA helicase